MLAGVGGRGEMGGEELNGGFDSSRGVPPLARGLDPDALLLCIFAG